MQLICIIIKLYFNSFVVWCSVDCIALHFTDIDHMIDRVKVSVRRVKSENDFTLETFNSIGNLIVNTYDSDGRLHSHEEFQENISVKELSTYAYNESGEREIKSISGNKLDYIGIKSAEAIDFRGDNMINFESLEKNSIDVYAATKSLYLQNRSKKIKNETGTDDDAWGDLDK